MRPIFLSIFFGSLFLGNVQASPDSWSLGPELRTFLRHHFQEKPQGFGSDDVPSIIWSLGGEIRRGPEVMEAIPPSYSLGWIKKADLERFIAIQDEALGPVAFRPSEADAAASQKIIDVVDGKIGVK